MKRPNAVVGKTYKITTGCGPMYVTVNRIEGRQFEVFARLGKAGGCSSSQTEALGRLISLVLRNKIPVQKILDDLSGISCQANAWSEDGSQIASCSDAIAKAIKMDIEECEKDTTEPKKNINVYQEVREESYSVTNLHETCPDCQSEMTFQEGCMQCPNCSYSKC